MTDCLFCKIIRGQLPSAKIYEDDESVAFLDIHPVRPGHALVVPKAHCTDFLDFSAEIGSALIRTTQKVAAAVMRATGAQGFNLGVNNGAAAGQVIFHLHLHVIPRVVGDGLRLWRQADYQEGEMARLAEVIRQALR